LPWSMWAMMQKLRIFSDMVCAGKYNRFSHPANMVARQVRIVCLQNGMYTWIYNPIPVIRTGKTIMTSIFKRFSTNKIQKDIPLLDYKRKTLQTLIRVCALLVVIILAVTLILKLTIPNLSDYQISWFLIYGCLIFLAGLLVIALLEHYVSYDAASLLFTLLITVIIFFADSQEELADGRSLIALILPVVVASVLLRPWAGSVIAVFFCAYITIFQILNQRGWPNIPAIAFIILVALIIQQATSNLERAISQALKKSHALLESEDRYRKITESSSNGIFTVNLAGEITDCNEAVLKMYGVSSKMDVLGLKGPELVHADEKEHVAQLLTQLFQQGNFTVTELKCQRKDGTAFITNFSAAIITDWEGKPASIAFMLQDITEQKQAETKLRESEEIFSKAFQLSPMPMAIAGPEGEYIEINQAFVQTLGYKYEELVGRTPSEVVIFVDPEQNRNAIRTLREQGRLQGYELAVKTRSGEILDGIFFAEPMQMNNRPMVLTLMYDITERKRIEDKLRESEKKYHHLIEALPIGVIVHQEGKIQLTNQTGAKILRAESPDSLIGRSSLDFVHPDNLEVAKQHIQEAMANLKFGGPVEEKMRRIDGTIFDAEFVTLPVIIEGKVSILAMFQDITERKKTESALKKSEENFRNLSENTADGILIAEPDGRHVYANRKACQILGYTQEEMIQTTIEDIADPTAIPMVKKTLQDRIAGRPVPATYETIVRRKDGTSFPVEIRGTRTLWQDQTCDLVLIRDITERKEAEVELKKSEENFRNLSENTADAILIATLDGRHLYANQAACQILGYTKEEIIQTTMVDIADPATLSLIKKRLQDRIADPTLPTPYETIIRRKDGTSFPVEIRGTRTVWQDQTCDLALIRDITERKKAQEAIKLQNQRIQEVSRQLVEVEEREKRNLASELHDDLGQSLASLKLMLELASSSRTNRERQEVIGDSLGLISELMGKVRNLSLDLRPAMLDDFGLFTALRWLFEQFHARTGIVIHCDHNLSSDQRFSPEMETAAFRITQEALTNVALHANVQEAHVNLEIGECLSIEISDNGTGFATLQEALDPTNSVGLSGMQERARLLGGLVEIHSEVGVGTRILATLPLAGGAH
jgi:PAS domain S-box-containing protein